jgi:IPT/TIG domain
MRTRMLTAGIVGVFATIACALVASAGARTVAAPEAQISGVTPMHAVVGQRITISGTGLNGTNAVTFGTVNATSVVVDPAGEWVRAVVPAGVPTGSVTITLDISGSPYSTSIDIGSGSVPAAANHPPSVTPSGGVQPKLRVAPRIVTFSPHTGHAGIKVRITGANLNGAWWVKFGFVRAQIKSNTNKAIIAIVPRNAHSGKIRIHTSGGTGVSTGVFKILGSSGV